MYVSKKKICMQENLKKTKMLALFNTLEEKDKDIVIAMAESLVEKSKGNNTAEMRAVAKQCFDMRVS